MVDMTLLQRAPRRPADAPFLFEREDELSAIDAALSSAAAGAGRAVVIEGEAGIGKSTLIRQAVAAAGRRGIRVLHARGGELERALPYGVVIELFGPVARDEAAAVELRRGPARIAAPLFALEPHAGDPQAEAIVDRADPVAYLHGLFWLVLNLVEDAPLAIVVDDAQWADEASLRFLHHLVKRIEEVPVAVILAIRSSEATSSSLAASLLRAQPEARHLQPRPLSETAVGELLATVAGRAVNDGLRRAASHATGGNPFFVTELAAELERVAEPDRHDLGTALPAGVGRHVDARLAAARPDARALAEAVAVLGESSTLHRAAALAGLDPSSAGTAARWLVGAAILVGSDALAFRHPIVRSAVDAAIPGPARAELHRRAGLLLADEGAPIGVIGAQLQAAATRADHQVVRLLRLAARDARKRGEPATEVALLRRALAEPPARASLLDILTQLARAEAAAGVPAAADTFAEALALADEPDLRARLRLDLGHTQVAAGQWPKGLEAFAQGLEESPNAAEPLRARLEAGYLSSAWVTMADRGEIGDRVQRILDADRLGQANRELAAWIAFQQGAVVGAPASEMGALVRRIFSEAPIEELVWEGQTVEVGVGVLVETDDLVLEVDVLSRAIAAAGMTGPIGKAGLYAYCRAWPRYYMGRLTEAIADGEEALRAAELGWEAFVPAAATVTALAYIERDELDAAEQVLALDADKWAGRIDTAMLVPLAQGRLALARGDVAGAVDRFRQAGEGAGAAFMRNNVPTDWRVWLATALLRLDQRDEARAIAAEGVEIARSWGAAWPLAASLRGAGLVEGGTIGIGILREAEELLQDGPAQLEHVRLLVTLGASLRRNGTLIEAREVLLRAADLARGIGARALLRRATEELRAAGARPRRIALTGVDALTPAELRVAQEALAGRTNREIAQALFVTPKTVEFHLANVYRKLGIASRTDLPTAMGEHTAA